MSVLIPKHVQELEPYRSGKPIADLAREKNLRKIVKLASNENPLGPSPKALAAIAQYLKELHRYPDSKSFSLVQALAKKFARKPEEIICANGSDSLLAYAVYAFSEEGDEILTSEGTFIGMYVNAKKLGRRLRLVPMRRYGFDLETIAKSINNLTRIIYLANPNNPTGSMFTKKDFEAFMEKIPKNILVILDEAYTLYAEDSADYPNGLDYSLPNVLVLRTFSKAYGLAGLRIGFAVGPQRLVEEMYKVRLPFEPNTLAQVAALGALDDQAFLEETKVMNRQSLDLLQCKFSDLGLQFAPTAANFIMLIFPNEKSAVGFYEECLNEGLIVRPLKSFGIPHGVRINSGTEEETRFAIEVIDSVCKRLGLKKPPKISSRMARPDVVA